MEGSGWIVNIIKSQFINISTYRPLLGTSYIKLPAEMTSTKKRANKHQKKKKKNQKSEMFLWCQELHEKIKHLLMVLWRN